MALVFHLLQVGVAWKRCLHHLDDAASVFLANEFLASVFMALVFHLLQVGIEKKISIGNLFYSVRLFPVEILLKFHAH